MSQVLDLLERGRSAPDNLSALDAVMGEDWAVVEFDQPRKAQLIRMALDARHLEDVSRKSVSSFGGESSYLPGYKPQAVVKMVRKGGAADLRGLKAQMAYLSRDGEQPLLRSERYMGVEIDDDERSAVESGWQMPPQGSGKADRTSHFIVSFPAHSGHDAAERAGRAWAEELFGSGDFSGDSYDYYTAFHTDRDHPHMHVIVNRRGLDNGAWLKVSQRSDLNYDAMRCTLVRVAAREGIELEATNRFERAIHDRPVPDAEYRRARVEAREVIAPAHTEQSAVLAAAALIHHARRFAADARLIERDAPEQAALLRSAAESISQGQALTEQNYDRSTGEQEIRAMSERLDEKRVEVLGNFEKLDRTAAQLEPGADRVRYERQIAELKAQSAAAMGRDQSHLRDYQEREINGRYRGFAGPEAGPQAGDVQLRTEARVRVVAERYGVNPDAAVERHSGGVPSRGLARQFAKGEAREREQSRADRGEREETPAQRDTELSKMHREIGAIYREAREQMAGRERDATPGAEREVDQARPRDREAREQAAGRGAGEPHVEGRGAAPDREADQDQSGPGAAAEAARRAEAEARQRAAEREHQVRRETETERWIKEREAREANDRDSGRGR